MTRREAVRAENVGDKVCPLAGAEVAGVVSWHSLVNNAEKGPDAVAAPSPEKGLAAEFRRALATVERFAVTFGALLVVQRLAALSLLLRIDTIFN